jgi:tryptophan 2,3-dioxygenase
MTTSYEKYIRPADLPQVRTLATDVDTPDEQFFIRTHQAFEIWFAQILAELEFARAKLSANPVLESEVPLIGHHLRRAASIFNLLHEHLPLLETLLTTDFFDFRQELFGAGGIESYRFREVEWLMGFREPDLLDYLAHETFSAADYEGVRRYQAREASRRADTNESSAATLEALRLREEELARNGSLRYHLLAWLRRTPYPDSRPGGPPQPQFASDFAARFAAHYEAAYRSDLALLSGTSSVNPAAVWSEAKERLEWFLSQSERCAILFVLQFALQPRLSAPAALLEAVLEVDEAFLNWRDRHIEMVARVIGGGRISTTGATGSGLAYLRGTTSKRAFPEVWDARSFLLGHAEARGIYEGQPGDWGHWRHYRLSFEVL